MDEAVVEVDWKYQLLLSKEVLLHCEFEGVLGSEVGGKVQEILEVLDVGDS